MIKCESCDHHDTCRYVAYQLLHTPLTLSEIEAESCEYFQDSSCYIKLPCRIGSTVYVVPSDINIWEQTVSGYHYNTTGKQKGLYLIVGASGMAGRINCKRFGIDVFTNKSDAEDYRRKLAYASND